VDLLKFAKEIAPGSFFLLMTALPALDTAIARSIPGQTGTSSKETR